MIETLRKYPYVLAAALVAVLIGFFLMGNMSNQNNSIGGSVIKLDDRGFTRAEYLKYGPNAMQLAAATSAMPQYAQYDPFIMSLIGSRAGNQEKGQEVFFMNHIALRDAANELGIHPGEAEIVETIKKIPAFQSEDGKSFDQTKYEKFIREEIGRLGSSEKDLHELIASKLIQEKLADILASGLNVNKDDVKAQMQAMGQKITAQYATLSLANYTSKIQPTDDEIKKFWEERKDSYKTEDRRKFTYVVTSPKYPAGAEKEPVAPKPAKEGDPTPELSDADKQIAKQRRDAEKEVSLLTEKLDTAMQASNGKDFEKISKENGWTIKSTELFSANQLPADLQAIAPRKTTLTLAEALFQITTTSDPLSNFTNFVPVGTADWFIARLDGQEPSRVKTYEEAKEEARRALINEKGKEAMDKAADDIHKKIEEAIKAGKTFADAAKENSLEVKTSPALSAQEQPKDISPTLAQSIIVATRFITPNTLAEVQKSAEEDTIIFLEKREIVKDPNAEKTLEGRLAQMKQGLKYNAFQAWLDSKNKNVSVTYPKK